MAGAGIQGLCEETSLITSFLELACPHSSKHTTCIRGRAAGGKVKGKGIVFLGFYLFSRKSSSFRASPCDSWSGWSHSPPLAAGEAGNEAYHLSAPRGEEGDRGEGMSSPHLCHLSRAGWGPRVSTDRRPPGTCWSCVPAAKRQMHPFQRQERNRGAHIQGWYSGLWRGPSSVW